MAARNRARYLAPIALAAAITVTYLVVHAALGVKSSSSHSQVVLPRQTTTTKRVTRASVYTVRSGDTLSQISVKTGVSVPTLEALNPGINPNALQTGQRLKLRR
jgi:LysM repeat protein